ncbi:unnamed protein product [Clonostachys rhizophaga]|uniref:Vegetative incompatibility protein HET-E-1 n=1 Tax=Clonostachys rhizophaga TaxID=160324 RepID=A0A9N9VX65_9HYPO|nr:unnamed protein product [Clonostachys rhizophaga]
MRLLDAETYLLKDSHDHLQAEPYAILSHTWTDHEITFKDLATNGSQEKLRADVKISGCCKKASAHGLNYVWIDTICIDKSSSAELSEAINSMYEWYSGAAVCYAYLLDVSSSDPNVRESELRRSRWFTRAWTLQELLAPREVVFYDSSWRRIGRKVKSRPGEDFHLKPFDQLLGDISGISTNYLVASASIERAEVAMKMRWAARRQATRREDVAYSLMGIFGVNMAMLYGEGDKAFTRLQEQIIANSDDETIFAWSHLPNGRHSHSLLAESPADFENSMNVYGDSSLSSQPQFSSHYSLTNKGLLIERQMLALPEPFGGFLLLLGCAYNPYGARPIIPDLPVAVLPLMPSTASRTTHGQLQRPSGVAVVGIRRRYIRNRTMKVYIAKSVSSHPAFGHRGLRLSTKSGVLTADLHLLESYPLSWEVRLDNDAFVRPLQDTASSHGEKSQQRLLLRVRGSNNVDYVVSLEYAFTSERPISLGFDITKMHGHPSLADLILEKHGNVLRGTNNSHATSEDGCVSLGLDKTDPHSWILRFHTRNES